MSLAFSVQDGSSLFGVGFNLNIHLERLQAAECFYQIRKEIERNKTSNDRENAQYLLFNWFDCLPLLP
jgi:hypothetical protein